MENKSKALEYLNIARSTFYYESLLEEKDADLRARIDKILDDNPSYGHRRIAIALKTNKKRVKRVMKKFGIKQRRGRKKPWKRSRNGDFEPSPNLLAFLFLCIKIISGLPTLHT